MGIGSTIKSDDGIGTLVAREFKKTASEEWDCIECETMPESYLSLVKKEKPCLVLMVDAAQMGLKPGETRLLSKEHLSSTVMGTHGLPLKQLYEQLEKSTKEIIFIGIQPQNLCFGEKLSPELSKASRELVETLKRKDWNKIPCLD